VLAELLDSPLDGDTMPFSKSGDDGHRVVSSSPSFAHNSAVIEVAGAVEDKEDLGPGTAVEGREVCVADTSVEGETVKPTREVPYAEGGVKDTGLSSPSDANTSAVIDAPF